MRQHVYADHYGVESWDPTPRARVFVHLCNSMMWREITGEPTPETPVSARAYAKHGLPWFDVYDGDRRGIGGSETLAGVRSIKEMDQMLGFAAQQDDAPVDVADVVALKLPPGHVEDGRW